MILDIKIFLTIPITPIVLLTHLTCQQIINHGINLKITQISHMIIIHGINLDIIHRIIAQWINQGLTQMITAH